MGGDRGAQQALQVTMVRPLRPVGPPDDPAARQLGTVEIGGSSFHFEAIAVHEAEAPGQVMVVADDPEDGAVLLQQLELLAGEGDPFETVSLGGREYVLYMTPYRR